jgi:hypothetical protein
MDCKEKYFKYKKKYILLKNKLKGGLRVKEVECHGPNIYNTEECDEVEFPCITPQLKCANIENTRFIGNINSYQTSEDLKFKSEYKSQLPGNICSGKNMYDTNQCDKPGYPCLTPELRCATLKNDGPSSPGVKGIASILTREAVDFNKTRDIFFNETDKKRYRLRLYPEKKIDKVSGGSDLRSIDTFIGCGGFACVYSMKEDIKSGLSRDIGPLIRLTSEKDNELKGFEIQYKLNKCKFINKLYQYGKYQLEKFNYDSNFYQNSINLTSPLNCRDKSGKQISECTNRNTFGLYGLIEPCYGGDLFEHAINRTYKSEISIKNLMKNILTGVKCIHDNNIIHMDLKLENIALVNKDDISGINILDFGLSLDTSKSIRYRPMIGSIDYMAPEVINRKRYNNKADIYSIGVILLMILTLMSIPRNKNHEIEWYRYDEYLKEDWMKEQFTLYRKRRHASHVSRFYNITHFLIKLLDPDPTRRYSAEEALAHPWLN